MSFTNQRAAYGQALVDLGKVNPNIVVLDADLGSSTMGRMFEDAYPDRHFEMGIAEANMIGVSAGLALTGKIPFANSFAVFASGRVYDQIRQSVCIGKVNVKAVGSSAGLSDFGDGATHQTIEDIAIMRALPNMTVISPADAYEAYQAAIACAKHDGPVYLRLNRNDYPNVTKQDKPFVIGEPEVLSDGNDVAIIATGYMVNLALEAAEALKGKMSAKVINLATIKPLDLGKIAKAIGDCKAIVTVEEHNIIGGMGSAVAEVMRLNPKPIDFIGINDVYGRSAGSYTELLEYYGLTSEKIAETVLRMSK